MKIVKYLIAAIIGLQSLSSCSDYLDKESDTELTLDMVFEDKTRMEDWLANVYSSIPDPIWGYAQYLGQNILGDDMTPSERWRQWGWDIIPRILGEWSTSSSWTGEYWKVLPQKIRSAYIFMEKVKPLPSQNVSAKEVEYMKAECRFLVAYYYYLLTNTYGPIPFRPNYVAPTDFTLSDLMIGQTPYDEIIDWLDKEMLSVSKLLPASYSEANKYGRITSVTCLAVRARMLLFAASPLVNGNKDYAGYQNSDGVELFNPIYSNKKWERAVQANKELIDVAHTGGYKLYCEYNSDGDIDPFASCQNLFLTTYAHGNKEILFARPSCDYGSFESHCTPHGVGGNGGYGVTQSLVDAFFMENGLSITDDGSKYVENGFSRESENRNTSWEWCKTAGQITEEGTYNMYCHREPRFYVTVMYNGAYYPADKRNVDFYYKGKDNDGTHDSPQNGYLNRKKVSPKSVQTTGYRPYRPGIIYRLGEAYLNYVEALNEWQPGNPEILFYLNKIRERAGVRQYTTEATDEKFIHVDLDDQEAIRKLIRAERRVELCCEGLRYDDLRRWKEAVKVLNGAFYGMNFNGTDRNSFFKRTVYQNRKYYKQYYWFPVFQDEMDKNNKLVQPPFWN